MAAVSSAGDIGDEVPVDPAGAAHTAIGPALANGRGHAAILSSARAIHYTYPGSPRYTRVDTMAVAQPAPLGKARTGAAAHRKKAIAAAFQTLHLAHSLARIQIGGTTDQNRN